MDARGRGRGRADGQTRQRSLRRGPVRPEDGDRVERRHGRGRRCIEDDGSVQRHVARPRTRNGDRPGLGPGAPGRDDDVHTRHTRGRSNHELGDLRRRAKTRDLESRRGRLDLRGGRHRARCRQRPNFAEPFPVDRRLERTDGPNHQATLPPLRAAGRSDDEAVPRRPPPRARQARRGRQLEVTISAGRGKRTEGTANPRPGDDARSRKCGRVATPRSQQHLPRVRQ
jgi:hypothetical protein